MKDHQTTPSRRGIFRILWLSATLLFIIAGTGLAQDLPAVWALQAESYSAHLGLKKSVSRQLSDAYASFREEVVSGRKELPAELPEDQMEMEEERVIARSRESFHEKLEGILEEEQVAGTILVLGSLNARWDTYVGILAGFNLPDGDLALASSEVCTYMVQYLEARAEAAKTNSRFSSVTAASLKGALDQGLSVILSEEQQVEWATRTARKPRQ